MCMGPSYHLCVRVCCCFIIASVEPRLASMGLNAAQVEYTQTAAMVLGKPGSAAEYDCDALTGLVTQTLACRAKRYQLRAATAAATGQANLESVQITSVVRESPPSVVHLSPARLVAARKVICVVGH